MRKLALEISDLGDKDGGGWADWSATGAQMNALQGVDKKAVARVGLRATALNMALS